MAILTPVSVESHHPPWGRILQCRWPSLQPCPCPEPQTFFLRRSLIHVYLYLDVSTAKGLFLLKLKTGYWKSSIGFTLLYAVWTWVPKTIVMFQESEGRRPQATLEIFGVMFSLQAATVFHTGVCVWVLMCDLCMPASLFWQYLQVRWWFWLHLFW